MKNVIRAFCLLTAATLLGCSSSNVAWQYAVGLNTVAAYQTFLKNHPNDPHDAAARQAIQTVRDGQDWITADMTNTLASYQKYITVEPNGAHVQEAHKRIMALQSAAAWQEARNAGTGLALQEFLQKYPNASQAQDARTMLMKYDYQAQLGAYYNSKAADMAKTRLEHKYGKDLQMVVVIPPSGKSHMYRVASAQMTRDQARTACDMLRKSHQRCEVMKHAAPAAG